MADRPDEMHATPSEDRPGRPDEKQAQGLDAVPNDMVDRPGAAKPKRGFRWRRNEDVDESPRES